MPLTDYLSREDQTQELHILHAIGRASAWWWRMKPYEFRTCCNLIIAVNLAAWHGSGQLRPAYLVPKVLK
ncbi:MAG: hypothetical protein P8O69_02515 [Amylibacter sp.]|nr:hypothetical protein [Amylibacter sp.]